MPITYLEYKERESEWWEEIKTLIISDVTIRMFLVLIKTQSAIFKYIILDLLRLWWTVTTVNNISLSFVTFTNSITSMIANYETAIMECFINIARLKALSIWDKVLKNGQSEIF